MIVAVMGIGFVSLFLDIGWRLWPTGFKEGPTAAHHLVNSIHISSLYNNLKCQKAKPQGQRMTNPCSNTTNQS